MASKRPNGIASRAIPCRFSSQCLVFSKHLQQADQVTGHMPLCDRLNAMPVDIPWNFNYQIIGKVGDCAATRHIHWPHFLTVVEYRVHDIDRKFKLMNTAT